MAVILLILAYMRTGAQLVKPYGHRLYIPGIDDKISVR